MFKPLVSYSVTVLECPLYLPFNISKGSIENLSNALVVFSDADNRKGLGEAAPFPVLTGDTQDIVLAAAREIASSLIGLTPAAALEKLHKELWPEFRYAPSACTGVEIALWDLLAQQMGCPLWMLWGRAGLKSVQTDITLPCLNPSETQLFWNQFSAARWPYVKVKVGGGTLSDDVERVMALLACAGKEMQISLDGNQGFAVESAKRLVAELLARNVHPLFFEQPLPEDDFAGMARLSETLSIPVCADESVKTLRDAMKIVNDRCAQMINLKFMKSGVRETLLIAAVAQRYEIPLMIGGMVETEIAMTASLHAVCGTGAIQWCDLDTPFFLRTRFTEKSPYHCGQAELQLPEGPGMGLKLAKEMFSIESEG